MDMQSFINAELAKQRAATLANSPQLTLGELITKLEAIPIKEQEQGIRYDFEYTYPTSLDSWRGSYAELALGWAADGCCPLLSTILKSLKDAVGAPFTGYKGGEFVMSNQTPLWVANYGNSGNTGIVGIKDEGYQVILLTAYCEF